MPTREQALAYRGLRSPVRWYGGKGQLVGRLVRLVPECWNAYIEPFCGGASLFFRLPPADLEVLNDLNEDLIGTYRALADGEVFPRLQALAAFTLYSRRQCEYCRAHWTELEGPAERAWAWWVVAQQSFSGRWGRGWSMGVGLTVAKNRALPYLSAVARLPEVYERLQHVRIECRDALEAWTLRYKPGAPRVVGTEEGWLLVL